MADDTMVERVAKAIWGADPYADEKATWEELGQRDELALQTQNEMRDIARAAIDAMRIPNAAMVDAAVRVVFENDFGQSSSLAKHDAGVVWVSMIDAALGEKTDAPKLV